MADDDTEYTDFEALGKDLEDFGKDVKSTKETAEDYAKAGISTYKDVKGQLEEFGLLPKGPSASASGRWVYGYVKSYPGRAVRGVPDEHGYAWVELKPTDRFAGFLVSYWPTWITLATHTSYMFDVISPLGLLSDIERNLFQAFGATTQVLNKIAALPPETGLGAASLSNLSSAQKTEYVANALVIAAAKYYKSPESFAGASAEIFQRSSERPAPEQYKRAIARLYSAARGVPLGQQQTTGENLMANGDPETLVGWEACLAQPPESVLACVAPFENDPAYKAWLKTAEPWKTTALAGKYFQLVEGLDHNTYVVYGKDPDTQKAMEIKKAIVVGGIAVVGGWWALGKMGILAAKKVRRRRKKSRKSKSSYIPSGVYGQ